MTSQIEDLSMIHHMVANLNLKISKTLRYTCCFSLFAIQLTGQFLTEYSCEPNEDNTAVSFPFELSSVTVNTSTSPAQIVAIAEDGTLLFENINSFGQGIDGDNANTIATCLTSQGNDFEGISYLFERNFRFYYVVLYEGSSTLDPNRLFLISTSANSSSNVSTCEVETTIGLEFAFRNGNRPLFNRGDGFEGVTIDTAGYLYFIEENEGNNMPKLYKSIQTYTEVSDFPDDALIIIEEVPTAVENQDFYGTNVDFSDIYHLSLTDPSRSQEFIIVSEKRKEMFHLDLARPEYFDSKPIADLQITDAHIYKPEGVVVFEDFMYIISDNQADSQSLTHFRFGSLPDAEAQPNNLFPDSTGGIRLGGLAAVEGFTYEWTPTTALSDPFIAQPIANPDSTTTYAIKVTNESGCFSISAYTLVVNVNTDLDNDGFSTPEDCDDTNPAINPNAVDFPDNGIDEDCDGSDVVSGVRYFSGFIKDQEGDGIARVAINLASGQSTTTDENGFFEFNNVVIINSLSLDYSRSDNPANGVSSVDLVRMANHILDLVPFTDDISPLAADINNDGSISSLDIVLLLRVILGLSTEFENRNSWDFVPQSITLTELPSEPIQIIGYKVGDVNGSADNN